MIKYTKYRYAMTSRYDARVGLLHVGAQDNGEGWWNWWVALSEQPFCAGETDIVESGGCPTLKIAKERIAVECEIVARRILLSVGAA